MVKIQVNSQGKAYITNDNKVLLANEGITPSGTIGISGNGDYDVTSYASAAVSVTKFGASLDNFIGEVENNVLYMPQDSFALSFDYVYDLAAVALKAAFMYKSGVTSVSFPSLIQITGDQALYQTFRVCTSLGSASFPELTMVSGSEVMMYAFQSAKNLNFIDLSNLESVSGTFAMAFAFANTGLTSVTFPKLKSISSGDQGLRQAFSECYTLTSASFPSLSSITSSSAMFGCFAYCISLTDVYFNALNPDSFGSKNDQFYQLLLGTGSDVTHTLHFPVNMESTISQLSGYPNFGGTEGSVTLVYDLPISGTYVENVSETLWTDMSVDSGELGKNRLLEYKIAGEIKDYSEGTVVSTKTFADEKVTLSTTIVQQFDNNTVTVNSEADLTNLNMSTLSNHGGDITETAQGDYTKKTYHNGWSANMETGESVYLIADIDNLYYGNTPLSEWKVNGVSVDTGNSKSEKDETLSTDTELVYKVTLIIKLNMYSPTKQSVSSSITRTYYRKYVIE